MKDYPYFFTWTAQQNALKIPLEGTTQFEMISEGHKIIDMSSLSYQASFGLKNPKILRAISNQMEEICIASPKNTFRLKEKVSSELIELASSKTSLNSYKCFFTQSGSESIENALKMARQSTGKKYILARKNSYHGSSLGSLSVTGDWRNKDHLSLSRYTIRVPCPTEDPQAIKLKEIIQSNLSKGIAAICLETITGGNGVIIPSKKWYQEMQKICRKNGILLILDEVVCGAHRTGPFFGFQNYKSLKPDFICLAKALTGGFFPLGAVLVSKNVAKYYDENTLSCGLTNYAHPLGLAAAQAVIDICKSKSFLKRIQENQSIFNLFSDKILKNENVTNVRKIGMLMAIDLKEPRPQTSFLKNEVYVAVQNQRPIIAPALIMPKLQLEKGLKAIEQTIDGL